MITDSSTSLPQKDERIRLEYLDGMRGWAALYVCLSHLWYFVTWQSGYDVVAARLGALLTPFKLLGLGHYAVAVFIVLSGYCLMLPVARSSKQELKDGVKGFAVRRARRILPAYYAALGFSLLLLGLFPNLLHPNGTVCETSVSMGGVLSHLFLAHNLFANWQTTINGPMWTVALEWQIYFVFALVLLPIWRKAGIIATVLIAFALGMLPALFHGEYICSWYLGLFSLGMLGAVVNFGKDSSLGNTRASERFAIPVSILLAGLFLGIALHKNHSHSATHSPEGDWLLLDILAGTATACFMIGSSAQLREKRPGHFVLRFLEQPVSLFLGRCSYSLYLNHYLILSVLFLGLVQSHHFSLPAEFGLLLLGGMPIVLGLSYGFYYLAERPFLKTVSHGSKLDFVHFQAG